MTRENEQQEEKIRSSVIKVFDAMLPDIVKKAIFTGAGMIFLTEEGIRKLMAEFNLPREAVNYVVKQSEKSKKELFGIIQNEVRRFFSAIDFPTQVREILDGMTFEVKADITIRSGDGEIRTEVKTKGKKRSKKRGKKRGKKKA